MPPLNFLFKDAFEPRIRDRGEEYFYDGAVEIPVVAGLSACLRVHGTKTYDVVCDWSLAGTRNEVRLQCSCPHYADGLFCKHCWAALLAIDDEGISSGLALKKSPRLLHGSDLIHDRRDAKESRTRKPKAQLKAWLRQLRSLQNEPARDAPPRAKGPRTAFYVLNLEETRSTGEISIEFFHQETLQSGLPGAVKHMRVSREEIPLYHLAQDRELMSLLLAQSPVSRGYGYYPQANPAQANGSVPAALQEDMLKKLAQTGRFMASSRYGESSGAVLRFDEGEPYRLSLRVAKEGRHFGFTGFLVRGQEKVPVTDPLLCLRSGVVLFNDRIARLEAKDHFKWIILLRKQDFGAIPESDGDELVVALCTHPHSPPVEWPEDLRWERETLDGIPSVAFTSPPSTSSTRGVLADLRFTYSDRTVSILDTVSTLLDKTARKMILRNLEQERAAFDRLSGLLGFTPAPAEHADRFPLRAFPTQFPDLVEEINSWGWKVEAYGKLVRQSGKFDIKVSSGVDWFDLQAHVGYTESISLGLPALIAALARGENLIPLDDGTLGMLPKEWLKKFAPLAQLGESAGGGYRFTKMQAAVLAAWLSAESGVRSDPDFSKLMKDINGLGELQPRSPTRSFRGTLRSYQKEGLAWLSRLDQLGFGGILADDMGLGKTIQVLAHLEAAYTSKTSPPDCPSIVILPKSLLFNWQEEARKFTPMLRVLAYSGQSRQALLDEIPKHDLVLVTYPVLRADFEELRKVDFHYVIADEAQAIKNADSISHKVCCLIRGSHRLAMTGTPIENSIDDLFAILDFVSPGLLGRDARERMSRAAAHGRLDRAELERLSKALRPFILRRTKDQVLKDLPEKTEMVLHCELSASERKNYVELRDYYRSHLRGEIERKGLARSKIVVLEALLRLRQAACHPGLIDKKRIDVESTKVDTLLFQLQELISEGHKALVFSQFTGFLDIVERRLAGKKIEFVRLDGKTFAEDRRKRVSRFQEDPALKVFLVSLKAGGVGLNLTAADYVFILDPWWNPAAESQAIDRTHRIGQKNKVIAYRLIAKDTVEERIAELQRSKRELADAIITADASLLRKMTAQDIEVLLS